MHHLSCKQDCRLPYHHCNQLMLELMLQVAQPLMMPHELSWTLLYLEHVCLGKEGVDWQEENEEWCSVCLAQTMAYCDRCSSGCSVLPDKRNLPCWWGGQGQAHRELGCGLALIWTETETMVADLDMGYHCEQSAVVQWCLKQLGC